MGIKVNGETIPERAIVTELKRLMDFYSRHVSREELGRSMETLLAKAKEHAIGTRLLLDEVRRRHVEVPESEVDASMVEMVKKAGNDRQLDAMLKKQGITREQLRGSIRVGKQLDRLVARITSSVAECPEEDLRKFYEEHGDRYVAPDEAQVRHILVKPASSSEADKAAAQSQLETLRHRIMEGEDFAGLAAAHSECPSGKQTGGSLGWLKQGATLAEFDAVVFDMEVGEISEVVETPLGMHIIEKLDHAQGEPMPFEDVRDRIRDLLMHERKGHALSEYVAQLRKDAKVEDDESEGSIQWDKVLDSFLDGQKSG